MFVYLNFRRAKQENVFCPVRNEVFQTWTFRTRFAPFSLTFVARGFQHFPSLGGVSADAVKIVERKFCHEYLFRSFSLLLFCSVRVTPSSFDFKLNSAMTANP